MIGGGVYWLMDGPPNPSLTRPNTDIPANDEMRLNHVTFRGLSKGKVTWEIVADHFDIGNEQSAMTFVGLKRAVLERDGKQELTITADSLQRNTLSGDLSITGHVAVEGSNISFKTPLLSWSDRGQVLDIPQKISAQLGDITLTADGGAVYAVTSAQLRCTGQLTLGVRGNLLQAKGAVIDTRAHAFSLIGPVHATIVVDDVQQWIAGKDVPHIPDLPKDIRQRLQAYTQTNRNLNR
jgi:hypothetical protein